MIKSKNILRQLGFIKYLNKIRYLLLLLLGMMMPHAHGNPTGGNVIAGDASISAQGSQTIINQITDKAIINWSSFNIGSGETTQFIQPNSSAIVLNRVLGNDPSQLLGILSANGQVMLINPAGIVFGAGSRVDVAALLATTLDIDNSDFLSGTYRFAQVPNRTGGYILNQGTLQAQNGGLVALVGAAVQNDGVIQANLGKIILASGTSYTIDMQGDGLINFATDGQVLTHTYDNNGQQVKDSVANHGTLSASGGQVLLTASAAKAVVDNAINNDGLIEATSAQMDKKGNIVLVADEGVVQVGGKLDVSGRQGGSVAIRGKNITLNAAKIDASGTYGGGSITIGKNPVVENDTSQAQTLIIDKDTTLNASATTTGDGGDIMLWSQQFTDYQGNLSATGGAVSGNGGFAEVSGMQLLNFKGQVNLSAPHGVQGDLLLDPYNISIQASGSTDGTLTDGTYTAGSNTSILLVSDLQNALANSNVLIQTGTSGSEAGDISVNSTLNWSSVNTLVLKAYRDINVNAAISNNAGGSLVLRADANATGVGTVNFGGSGSVNVTNGGSITFQYNPTGDASTKYQSPTDFSPWVTTDVAANFKALMLVNNLTDLQNISLNLAGNYALGADIDASATASWNSGAGFVPIGDINNKFTGYFTGNGHTIDSLSINRSNGAFEDRAGLFSDIAPGSKVELVNFTNADIMGYFYSGIVAGVNYGTIENVKVSGNVHTYSFAGGIAGANVGTIRNAFSTATTSATQNNAAALVGLNYNGSSAIYDSYWDTAVSGSNRAVALNNGGIVVASGGTTSTMMAENTFSNWDFSGVWAITEGTSYPYLRIRYPAEQKVSPSLSVKPAAVVVPTIVPAVEAIIEASNGLISANSGIMLFNKADNSLDALVQADTEETNETSNGIKLSVCKA